jgi:hypothetical protein
MQRIPAVMRGERCCRRSYLLIRYFVDPPERFLLIYKDPNHQLYFSQRKISGSVGRLPYIRMPTR